MRGESETCSERSTFNRRQSGVASSSELGNHRVIQFKPAEQFFFPLPAYSVTKSRRLFIFILLLLFFFWRAFLTLLLHRLLLKKQTPEHPAVTCSQTEGIRRLSFLFCFFLFSHAACVLSAKLPDCSKSSAWAPPAHLLAYDCPQPHRHTHKHTPHIPIFEIHYTLKQRFTVCQSHAPATSDSQSDISLKTNPTTMHS